jgi:predicted metal-dependent peptidase
MNQGDRIKKLMEALVSREPFFAHLILSQQLVEERGNSHMGTPMTIGVDGLRLYYNPDFIKTLSDAHLTGILCHEALHLAYMHPMRRNLGKERDPALYNIACDAVINPILKRRGYDLPEDGVSLPVRPHETSEEVYDRLECKMGGGGASMPKWGTVMDLKTGETREATEAEAMEAQGRVIEAAQKAREAGKMPGDMESIIDVAFYGKRDWKDFLRKFLGGGHERQRTWSRRNKRFPDDVILPALGAYGPGEIVVIIDTSGSIDEELGRKFVAEVARLNDDLTPEKVHVICCDAAVQWTRSYDGYERIEGVQFRGRGGTDFRPPFEWIKSQGISPKAAVYFTDLECSNFPSEPEYPVAWIVWPGGADRAPFGEIVRM